MSDLVERWPGYNEQSWAQRFAELDRQFSKERDTAVKVVCQLSSQTSARITELETALAEARNAALEEAAKACEAERLSEPQDESDAAYDRAIDHCAQAIRDMKTTPDAELLDRMGNGDLPTAMDIAIGVGEEAYARTGVTPAMRELMALYKKNQKGHPPACCCAECAKDWMDDGKEGV